ncbi:MAG TPA: hypothetical protein ENK46_05325 [Flavobacteriia bacterium]|nr:hypothetical protein [Flavobacteriia bacterium]
MSRYNYLPFGDENAESDELLIPCQVDKKNPEEHKPILIGRWGIGKTALLLLQNQQQTELLKSVSPELERIWYLSESSLDVVILSNLKGKYQSEPDVFIKSLEEIWKSEICRIYTIILAKTKHLFKNKSGKHWNHIETVAKSNKSILKTIWKQVPNILDSLTNGGDSNTFDDIKNSVDSLVSDATYENIIKCLQDIQSDEYLPCIVIEPIETPTSALEKQQGLAQYLIIALLNTFYKYFRPDRRNFFIRISIPWHRYVVKETDFPQKIYQHKGSVEWHKEKLKEFIEKRIKWEFDRIGKKYNLNSKRGLWYVLFEDTITNGWCVPAIAEDSFDYFLRHTHYRARDLLRLTRECVLEEAKIKGIGIDDVLLYGKISAFTISETFHRVGPQITGQLIEEGNRRFPGLSTLTDHLKGLPLPFSTEEFKKRIKNITNINFNDAINMMWESGLLGVCAKPLTQKCSKRLAMHFTAKAKRTYRNKVSEMHELWTWFEYNYEGKALELMGKLNHLDCTEHGLVFHPKTFEFFFPNPKELSTPIGV